MPKPLTVWITANSGKFFKSWEYQTTLPASREICMQVKKQQLEPDMEQLMDWLQIEKGVDQGCILSSCLFNLYAEQLDEAQAGIKIAGRNVSYLRYADDTTLMVEREEELKSFLMKVKEESETVGLKLLIQKTKIMSSSPITSWQMDEDTMETVTDSIFLGSKIIVDGDCKQSIHWERP